jgi:hypothetical protein
MATLVVMLVVMIVAVTASFVATWVWRFEGRVLEVMGPTRLLGRINVRIIAVLVHDRSVMVGVRDEADHASLLTLVASTGRERDCVVATLEDWRASGSRLELDRAPSGRRVELRQVDEKQTLAFRLAA